LTRALLDGADLRETKLDGAIGLTREHLQSALADDATSANEATRKYSTDYLNTLLKYRLEAPKDTPAAVLERVDREIQATLKALQGTSP
jgi:hypothetical protein